MQTDPVGADSICDVTRFARCRLRLCAVGNRSYRLISHLKSASKTVKSTPHSFGAQNEQSRKR